MQPERRRGLRRFAVRPGVQVLNTRAFRREFLGSLSRDVTLLSIVSPFITTLRGFESPFRFFHILQSRLPGISLQLVTRPPDDGAPQVLSWVEGEQIDRLGVELLIRSSPLLHSKVYYIKYREGDSSSFVGSANFTRGGFERNDETMAFWRRGEDNFEVEKEISRLTGPGSFTFLQWKARVGTSDFEMENGDDD